MPVAQSRCVTNNTISERRSSNMIATEVKKGHKRQLVLVFCLWKALLLILAIFCPGPGYDTSALILLDPSIERHRHFSQSSRHDRLVLNLFRWDSIYFVKAAERNKVHEQEWAFSWAYSKLIGFVARRKRTPFIVITFVLTLK